MGLPTHVPLFALSVCPSWGVPLIVGREVFVGGAGEVTTVVGTELTEVEPAEFLAVTTERIVWPTSEPVGVYVFVLDALPVAAPSRSSW